MVDNRQDASVLSDTSERRARAWRTYFEASGRLQGALESRMKTFFNLSLSDYSILLALLEAPQMTLRMGDIAKHIAFSPSRVTYLINNLVKDGLVERRASVIDGRGYDAVLTEKGQEIVDRVTRLHQKMVREYLVQGLSEQQIDNLVDIMEALEKRMRFNVFAL